VSAFVKSGREIGAVKITVVISGSGVSCNSSSLTISTGWAKDAAALSNTLIPSMSRPFAVQEGVRAKREMTAR
jgi:hypothetical protein